ncbi:MAG TPA: Sir2 family NAD-dependent protein deacetylase, partial [Blastocatellia bacterium]|nr:Sir2 family NAD-dependent protein deacetylase [Blastocatellia bacterium]
IPEEKVIELHGNSTYAVCLSCERRYELAPILAAFRIDEQPPECECGGLIKTATISFGQPMPVEAMQNARLETEACDLFLAVGSSLVVYPAAGFPALARQHGARLVIINRDSTELDYLADLVLNAEIGDTLGEVTGVE